MSFVKIIFRRVSYLWHAGLTRAWTVEAVLMAAVGVLFYVLLRSSSLTSAALPELLPYVLSTLPVLAISNALPMLGAAAFLARYSVSEKPTETMKEIEDLLEANRPRFDAQKENNYFKLEHYSYMVNLGPDKFVYREGKRQLFIERPFWDGVWYFGPRDEDNNLLISITHMVSHEVLYCSYRVLGCVRKLRRSRSWLVGGKYGGTSGSDHIIAHMGEFDGVISKPLTSIPKDYAARLARLAAYSIFYMREELHAHRSAGIADESRDTEFIHLFCEYLKWLGFLHGKLVRARWLHILEDRYSGEETPTPGTITRDLESISSAFSAVSDIQANNLPRRLTAARIRNVRHGVILPIAVTGLATLICLSLKLLADPWPDAAFVAALIAYALVGMGLIANFAFGLWLMLPKIRPLE